MTKDETEGRIRAIEAVLLHLPGINPDLIHVAKDWNRNPRRQPNSKVAKVKLEISGHLDEQAEKALDELKYQFQKFQGAKMQRPPRWRPFYFFHERQPQLLGL